MHVEKQKAALISAVSTCDHDIVSTTGVLSIVILDQTGRLQPFLVEEDMPVVARMHGAGTLGFGYHQTSQDRPREEHKLQMPRRSPLSLAWP